MRSMKTALSVAIIVWLCITAASVDAQTSATVPYQTAQFYWDAPTTALPTYYLLNCGTVDINIVAPATQYPVKSAVPGEGAYTCTLKAGNEFGISDPATVSFTTGLAPSAPPNIHVKIK